MTTFADLKTGVASDLFDDDHHVFELPVIGDFINAAIAVVGRIAPERFLEEVTPIENTLSYQLRPGSVDPVDEVEVKRVEVWDGSQTPPVQLGRLQPAAGERESNSQNGWEVWGGVLYLTNRTVEAINPDTDIIKVWGYAPSLPLVDDDDVYTGGNEREQAVRDYCRVKGLRRLVFERDLFTQWQTRTNNTDASPAALMNGLAQAEEDWRRSAKALLVLREGQ